MALNIFYKGDQLKDSGLLADMDCFATGSDCKLSQSKVDDKNKISLTLGGESPSNPGELLKKLAANLRQKPLAGYLFDADANLDTTADQRWVDAADATHPTDKLFKAFGTKNKPETYLLLSAGHYDQLLKITEKATKATVPETPVIASEPAEPVSESPHTEAPALSLEVVDLPVAVLEEKLPKAVSPVAASKKGNTTPVSVLSSKDDTINYYQAALLLVVVACTGLLIKVRRLAVAVAQARLDLDNDKAARKEQLEKAEQILEETIEKAKLVEGKLINVQEELLAEREKNIAIQNSVNAAEKNAQIALAKIEPAVEEGVRRVGASVEGGKLVLTGHIKENQTAQEALRNEVATIKHELNLLLADSEKVMNESMSVVERRGEAMAQGFEGRVADAEVKMLKKLELLESQLKDVSSKLQDRIIKNAEDTLNEVFEPLKLNLQDQIAAFEALKQKAQSDLEDLHAKTDSSRKEISELPGQLDEARMEAARKVAELESSVAAAKLGLSEIENAKEALYEAARMATTNQEDLTVKMNEFNSKLAIVDRVVERVTADVGSVAQRERDHLAGEREALMTDLSRIAEDLKVQLDGCQKELATQLGLARQVEDLGSQLRVSSDALNASRAEVAVARGDASDAQRQTAEKQAALTAALAQITEVSENFSRMQGELDALRAAHHAELVPEAVHVDPVPPVLPVEEAKKAARLQAPELNLPPRIPVAEAEAARPQAVRPEPIRRPPPPLPARSSQSPVIMRDGDRIGVAMPAVAASPRPVEVNPGELQWPNSTLELLKWGKLSTADVAILKAFYGDALLTNHTLAGVFMDISLGREGGAYSLDKLAGRVAVELGLDENRGAAFIEAMRNTRVGLHSSLDKAVALIELATTHKEEISKRLKLCDTESKVTAALVSKLDQTQTLHAKVKTKITQVSDYSRRVTIHNKLVADAMAILPKNFNELLSQLGVSEGKSLRESLDALQYALKEAPVGLPQHSRDPVAQHLHDLISKMMVRLETIKDLNPHLGINVPRATVWALNQYLSDRKPDSTLEAYELDSKASALVESTRKHYTALPQASEIAAYEDLDRLKSDLATRGLYPRLMVILEDLHQTVAANESLVDLSQPEKNKLVIELAAKGLGEGLGANTGADHRETLRRLVDARSEQHKEEVARLSEESRSRGVSDRARAQEVGRPSGKR